MEGWGKLHGFFMDLFRKIFWKMDVLNVPEVQYMLTFLVKFDQSFTQRVVEIAALMSQEVGINDLVTGYFTHFISGLCFTGKSAPTRVLGFILGVLELTIPIGSMGLVYLSTFTTKINHSCNIYSPEN